MNKLIASAGLIAVSVTGLRAENTGNLTAQEASKPWSVSAALRGFYDDNYATAPDNSPAKLGSFGVEISPSFAWNLPRETTYIGLAYTYDLKYYFDRPKPKDDQSHDFTAKLDHRFSNRYSVNVEDSFVYSSDPELIDQNQATPIRSNSEAVRNLAGVNFQALITEVFGLEGGYGNGWYNYLDSGAGSRSSLLDRLEHSIHLDGRWQLRENSLAKVGYQFGVINYTSSDPTVVGGTINRSDTSDETSHYLYVGAEHSINSNLSVDAEAGAQLTDYSAPNQDNSIHPRVDVSGVYTYLPGSSVRLSLRYLLTATDIASSLNQELTVVSASWTHQITPMLTGGLVGSYQHSVFNGGPTDGEADDFFLLGLNFAYRFNQFWSADVGYNWDRLESSLPDRSFTRNRVYFGVHADF